MGHRDLPLAPAREHIKAFKRLGWSVRSQRGSHIALTKAGAASPLIVPDHGDVKRALLAKLLKLAGVTEQEYCDAFAGR